MRADLRSSAQVSSSPFAGGTAMTGRAVKWIEQTRAAPAFRWLARACSKATCADMSRYDGEEPLVHPYTCVRTGHL